MSDTQACMAELEALTQKWIDAGVAPADVVDLLVGLANRIIDRNNLEYAELLATKQRG